MKALLFCLALFCLGGWGFVAFMANRTYVQQLMPGQSFVLTSDRAFGLDITSEYPVRVDGTGCNAPRAVGERLECDAGQVTISDLRPTLLVWARSNRLTYTVHRHILR